MGGGQIKAYDPIGIPNFSKIYPEESNNIQYCDKIEDTLKDADICFIFTEWKEIKELNPNIFKKYMKTPIVLDGRNCYKIETMQLNGIEYDSIGR